MTRRAVFAWLGYAAGVLMVAGLVHVLIEHDRKAAEAMIAADEAAFTLPDDPLIDDGMGKVPDPIPIYGPDGPPA